MTGVRERKPNDTKKTDEALGREVDRVQVGDRGVEVARGSDERLDGSDHLVRGLSHGPDDTQEGNKDSGEERAEELHSGED